MLKRVIILLHLVFLLLLFGCSDISLTEKNEFDLKKFPILSKIEYHKTPPIPENYPIFPLPYEAKNKENYYLKVRKDMLKKWIEEGDGYTQSLKKCGDSAVLPTYAQQLIWDIDFIVAVEFNKKLELTSGRKLYILEAINYIMEKSLWNGLGSRFWANKKFLETLSEKEKELLVDEIVKYVKLYGVKGSEIFEKNKANNIAFINQLFNNLKNKKDISINYCNPFEIYNFSGVEQIEKWEFLHDRPQYKYTVRVYSKNLLNERNMEIFDVYINHDDLLSNCIYEHTCIEKIRNITDFSR
jgi:hypothetical protein